MQQGKLIVFEGPDFSGKTKQIGVLGSYLKTHHPQYGVFVTSEPTTNNIEGRLLRKIILPGKLNGKVTDETVKIVTLYFFLKNRELHIPELIERKDQGDIVLLDRYRGSTSVYQSAQGLFDLEDLIEVQKHFTPPDKTFLLNVSVYDIFHRQAMTRTKEYMASGTATHTEIFDREKKEFYKILIENYHKWYELSKDVDNIVLIDASKSIEEVFEQIKPEVDKLLVKT